MNLKETKKLARSLTEEWGIKYNFDIDFIIDSLQYSVLEAYSDFNTFEFSLVSNNKSIRLLHLNFYKCNLGNGIIKRTNEKRIESILRLIKCINKKTGSNYNIELAKSTMDLASDLSLPIQVGLEVRNRCNPIIKLYFSIVNNSCDNSAYSLIYNILEIKKEITNLFINKQLDAIGIDFLHDSASRSKIYTRYNDLSDIGYFRDIYNKYNKITNVEVDLYLNLVNTIDLKHIGFLYRVSDNAKIDSVKVWARLRNPITLPSSGINNEGLKKVIKWWDCPKDLINQLRGKISYVVLENDRKGVYLR